MVKLDFTVTPTPSVELPVDYNSIGTAKRAEVRNLYVAKQGGLCAHCKHSLVEPVPHSIAGMSIDLKLFPPYFLKHPVHLHHDHDTGLTIGAVHARCNAVLWQYYNE